MSTFSPLSRPAFRDRWVSSVISNSGRWMHDTAAAWLMTSLTPSPLLVALMQTATALPVLILGVPAGALADRWDRRRLLIFWQAWMLVAALLLAASSLWGVIEPWSLVGLTLLLNFGAAMNNPAWQATVPELVPRDELSSAIALNSAGFNLARALGPAIGGLVVAAASTPARGAASVFALNALSFVAVLVALQRWRRPNEPERAEAQEPMLDSIRTGLSYVANDVSLRGILLRAFFTTSGVSAMWALLAVVARQDVRAGAIGYGLFTACIGVGAVFGAGFFPAARRRFTGDQLLGAATIAFALTLLAMAFVERPGLLGVTLFFAGIAWTTTTSTFNVAVQASVPAWVQARTLGVYQMTFHAGMALGATVWGAIAERLGVSTALAAAAVALLATMPWARRFAIPSHVA